MWDGLAPLLWTRFDAPISTDVVMVDASDWGLGAVRAQAPAAQVAETIAFSERWRAKQSKNARPRERALQSAARDLMLDVDAKEGLCSRDLLEPGADVSGADRDPFDLRKPGTWKEVPLGLLGLP